MEETNRGSADNLEIPEEENVEIMNPNSVGKIGLEDSELENALKVLKTYQDQLKRDMEC